MLHLYREASITFWKCEKQGDVSVGRAGSNDTSTGNAMEGRDGTAGAAATFVTMSALRGTLESVRLGGLSPPLPFSWRSGNNEVH